MATKGDSEQLSGRQIVRLAASIPADDMAAIAKDYMNISYMTIRSMQRHNPFGIQHSANPSLDNEKSWQPSERKQLYIRRFVYFLYNRYMLIKIKT